MNATCETIYQKLTAIFIVGSFLIMAFISLVPRAQAATSTVRGIGWWGDGLQEVYFNCLDDKIGDRLDVFQNLSGSGKYSSPNELFHFYSTPCSDLVHGVYIDSDNNFSGQAWNPTKGLISFSGTTTPPDGYGDTSPNCAHTCNNSNNCWACYNEDSQSVYGWARVDSDGTWIKLNSALTPPVKLQNCGATSVWPGYGVQSGDFVGYASSTLGALSFNCKSESGGNMCGLRDYKVYISNLTIGSLSAPNWTYEQACLSTARGATLKWCKRSGTQTAYEIVVNSTNTFSTSTAICWSGKKISDFAAQYNLPNSDPTCGSLAYNSNYYWWIRLYDETDTPTGWYQYYGNKSSDSDRNIDNNAYTFTTYKHEFPSPYFTWSPYEILVGTTTNFTAVLSRYYTTAAPNTPNFCVGSNCSYLWSANDSGAIISTTTGQLTGIIFNLATSTLVTLKVTDTDNYYCSMASSTTINYGLPIWREIKAK
ncbi:MAG: hypothetical protein WCN88_05155 [Candidatus Falkowbacteria bacterium]